MNGRTRPLASGAVALVGAGPGDPELLTLKAVRLLQEADVVLYDALVSPAVLALAREGAERVSVGKRGGRASCRQDEICATMTRLAREGRAVVRLKCGDPGVFGRAGEELEACRAAGVAVTIVPGVTAAQGAAAALGVSLTERATARRVQFVAGHGRDGRLPADLDWSAIADPKATTALYMGRATLAAFRDRALAAGLPPGTPAAAVLEATCPDERRLLAPLGALPEAVARAFAGREGPLLILIGAPVARAVGSVSSVGSVASSER